MALSHLRQQALLVPRLTVAARCVHRRTAIPPRQRQRQQGFDDPEGSPRFAPRPLAKRDMGPRVSMTPTPSPWQARTRPGGMRRNEKPEEDRPRGPRPSALHYQPAEAPGTAAELDSQAPARPAGRWSPTKKVSLPTMAGIKALYAEDPVAHSPQELSRQFGISYEAVKRILKSKFREKTGDQGLLKGTKWDPSPMSNPEQSPVAAIKQAFAQARDQDR